jgi:hypothetical protein
VTGSTTAGGGAGASKTSEAHRLSQSSLEKYDARTMCTDLISHTPARGSANEKAPRASL